MQINPPFGYQEIVPLYKVNRVRLPPPGSLPDFLAKTNAVPLSYSEFAVAGRDFPLAFTSSDGGQSFAAIAVLGLATNENLFVVNGRWDEGAYLPAYVRRYPFCMSRVTLNAIEQADRLICVEKTYLADDGERMFDDAGGPLERWRPIDKLLNEYEADLDRGQELCAILADYGLLEPFTLQAVLNEGGAMNLGGMYRVEEKKLEFLNAAQHKNLIKKGIMGRIYAHLLSLDNFARLLTRRSNLLKLAGAAA
jgi:hypothetical protein